jgi:Dolichyl-phosphate-mannose-protein mannosyltransferase
VLVLAVAGVAAVAFSRALHSGAVYDEGVYLASLDALEHGQRLGADVFVSQPPGFYVLLEAERAVAGASIVAMRAAMLVLALVGCFAAYYVGRFHAGPKGGFLAMMLLAAPSRVEDQAVQVRADVPSVALSLVAIALALDCVRRERHWAQLGGAALAGAVLAAAVSVKLLAITTAVPVLVIFILAKDRRLAIAAAAGAATVVAALAGFYHSVLGQIWDDAVRYHLVARTAAIQGAPHSIHGNVEKIIGTLSDFKGPHSPFPWLFILGAAASLLAWKRRREFLPLWLWVATSAVFLAWHRPLWAHDVVILTASLAVASGIGIATLLDDARILPRALASACALIIAATLLHHLPRTSPGQDPGIASAAAFLRNHTAPGSEVASDVPIIPFLAGRRQPGPLVDTSWTRLGSGWLTPREFLHTLQRDHVGAVVIGHSPTLTHDAPLLKALHARLVVAHREPAVALPGETAHELQIFLPRGPHKKASGVTLAPAHTHGPLVKRKER